jgi:hypothetical protein
MDAVLCYVLLQCLPLGFPQDSGLMGNMVRLCSAHSTTESHECCPPVSIRPQYALEWDDRSCDVQQCAEHAWATGKLMLVVVEQKHVLCCEHADRLLLVVARSGQRFYEYAITT